MRVRLAYGVDGLEVELPDDRATVILPSHEQPAPDATAEVLRALRQPLDGRPLRELVQRGQTVAISICDGTRAQPRDMVVPAILDEFGDIVDLDDVVILVATGTHRGNTPEELRAMLGDDVVDSVRVVNHDARDDASLQWVGRLGAGVPVWLNREWLEADVRITTGSSSRTSSPGSRGGPKMVAPGLAGLETVLALHDACAHRSSATPRGASSTATRSTTTSARSPPRPASHFTLDVIARPRAADRAGVRRRAARRCTGRPARRRRGRRCAPCRSAFDVVLTTNSGFPLDQNLYQAVKGMSAAAQVVKPGGTIICAAECRDGFPDHGSFREQLPQRPRRRAAGRDRRAPDDVPDQWQVQVQAPSRPTRGSSCTPRTSPTTISRLPTWSRRATSAHSSRRCSSPLAGTGSQVCVLPEGPQTIPYVG